ncbi:CwfJ C-terminus 1-domain-containing protein-like protein [Podospora fimiseda]|uniref:CwfJ C-terminus 1-domain-containing protein-like protein n=1 Tax=Podospora fimiseda TaxID=252190 RepID=A0AAN7H4X0_9PEZI|nr:CwfJ C-terminus 1-domain-containing protein-like protein [Podospora fimiseda]
MSKLFIFGSIQGQLRSAFSKLSALQKKNHFDCAIVAGNLFSHEHDDQLTELLDGRLEIPCPTYFTVGTIALPPRIIEKIQKDEEIAPNLHYLGKRSTTKTSEGIRIVTLGGILDPNIIAGPSKEQYEPFHTEGDAKSLIGAQTADILLTTMWPADVWKNSTKAKESGINAEIAPGSSTIAELCAALKPRYHISMSPGDFFFEREPFFPQTTEEDKEKGIPLTRFISLAPLGNTAKAKAMYAFNLNREAIVTPPAGSTVTPFYKPPSKKRFSQDDEFSRFGNGHRQSDRHQKRRRQQSPPPGPERCFFCLCNPNFSTHMVCSIAEDAYLATAKGPLPASDTFKLEGLNFPGHFIITPVEHISTLSAADLTQEKAQKTFREMKRFRDSLQGMIASVSKRKLGAVTWEISRARNIHDHWQFMPVPADMVIKGLVEAGFRVLAEDLKLGKFTTKEFETADQVEGDFLRVWTWAEEEEQVVSKSLLLKLDEEVWFDLQYPRKVMAKLLGLEQRTSWQDVVQTEDEEKADVEAFREAFKEWDFTL